MRIREGALSDDRTLSGFAAEHSLTLTRFAYLLCADHQRAEDLVQDAFLSLYRRFGDALPLDAPLAYARRTIVNANVSRTRKRSAGEQVTADVPDSPASDADVGGQDEMWRALAVLPDRQRAVLVLRYYLDLPDSEIARALSCREGTVRSLATRAFAAIRTHPALGRTQEHP